MSGPDRIWATAYYNQNRSEHVREWATRPYEEKQDAEYVRRDPAVLAALPEVQALVAEAVAQERERCALIADAYADENIRMAGDTVLLDPVLHTPKGHRLTAKDFAKSDELVVSGAVHSAMFHAAQNIAAAIRAGGKP
jgi:hypothetical protein